MCPPRTQNHVPETSWNCTPCTTYCCVTTYSKSRCLKQVLVVLYRVLLVGVTTYSKSRCLKRAAVATVRACASGVTTYSKSRCLKHRVCQKWERVTTYSMLRATVTLPDQFKKMDSPHRPAPFRRASLYPPCRAGDCPIRGCWHPAVALFRRHVKIELSKSPLRAVGQLSPLRSASQLAISTRRQMRFRGNPSFHLRPILI